MSLSWSAGKELIELQEPSSLASSSANTIPEPHTWTCSADAEFGRRQADAHNLPPKDAPPPQPLCKSVYSHGVKGYVLGNRNAPRAQPGFLPGLGAKQLTCKSPVSILGSPKKESFTTGSGTNTIQPPTKASASTEVSLLQSKCFIFTPLGAYFLQKARPNHAYFFSLLSTSSATTATKHQNLTSSAILSICTWRMNSIPWLSVTPSSQKLLI